MLSDEEREALEILNNTEWEGFMITIKNLIKKQSKEIEELKNEVMEKELIIDGMKEDRRIAVEEIQEQYYVSKDKIKEKIEEVKDGTFDAKIVLQSLLEKEKILNRLFQKNN